MKLTITLKVLGVTAIAAAAGAWLHADCAADAICASGCFQAYDNATQNAGQTYNSCERGCPNNPDAPWEFANCDQDCQTAYDAAQQSAIDDLNNCLMAE